MFRSDIFRIFIAGITIALLPSCAPKKTNVQNLNGASSNEIIYHVSQESFYDSGLQQKLDHLQGLGITSILSTSTPLRNYEALAKEIRRRGMKWYRNKASQDFSKGHLIQTNPDQNFSVELALAFRSLKKDYVSKMADSTFGFLHKRKQPMVFIENNDMPAFSFIVEQSLPKMKIGAALNLLSGGVPSIYEGQETGNIGQRSNTYEEGILLEQQMADPNSIFNFYKKMIRIRKAHPLIGTGTYETLPNNNDYIYSFQRYDKNKAIIVAINFSEFSQRVAIINPTFNFKEKKLAQLNGNEYPKISEHKLLVQLPPYGIEVWHMK